MGSEMCIRDRPYLVQLVVHVAGFAAVVAEIEPCFITGEVHRQQAAAHLQFAAAQLEDLAPVLHRLGGEALKCIGIIGGQHMGVAVEGAGEALSQCMAVAEKPKLTEFGATEGS